MTPAQFLARVTLDTGIAIAALAFAATWIGGASAGVGVLAGGAVAVGSLWWVSRGALAMTGTTFERGRWVVASSARFAVIAGAIGLVLVSGLAHPVALVAGMTVLPCALITEGLRSARHLEG